MTPAQIAALPPQDRQIARLILKRGLTATYNGYAWHVTGPGVDVRAVRLFRITDDDLRPAHMGKHLR